MEDRAGGHAHAEHLLEAHGLRAELNVVREASGTPSSLVLDGKGPRRGPVLGARVLDDVRVSEQAEPLGAQRNAAKSRDPVPASPFASVRSLMERAPFGREAVLRPEALDVDERALPLAEEEVLEARDREQEVVGDHVVTGSMTRTPLGGAPTATT